MVKAKRITLIIIAAVLIIVIAGILHLWSLFWTRISVGTVPTKEQVANSKTYDNVVIFGVDGAGGYFEKADTPNFDRIFKDGSVTYKGYSQFPTTSAHNWTSMLHGVRYQTHKVDNSVAETTPFTNTDYPSIFKVYQEKHNDARFLSVCNWTPINFGTIENGISGMEKINIWETGSYSNGSDADNGVCTTVISKLDEYVPNILFMQFDSVDGAGHGSRYGSESFSNQLTIIDGYIGQIYDKYVELGKDTNTLFICVSDHGHGSISSGHGANFPTQRYVTCAVYGAKGDIVKGKMGHFVTQDIASIVLYALGVEQPSSYESKVPNNLFNNL